MGSDPDFPNNLKIMGSDPIFLIRKSEIMGSDPDFPIDLKK